MDITIIFIFWLVCAALGYAVAGENKKGLGAVMGFLLGPIGVLIAVFLK